MHALRPHFEHRPRLVLLPAKYTDIMRFLTYYVHVTKCLLDTKYEQNPKQTALNKVVRLKGIYCDAYAKWFEFHSAAILDMYAEI